MTGGPCRRTTAGDAPRARRYGDRMVDHAMQLLGRRHVLERFRWIDGDADTWAMLRDANALQAIVAALADLLADRELDVVVGIEARGFALGPAVALALGVGFSPIRKDGAMFPGDVIRHRSEPDYRGRTQLLAARRDHFAPGHRAGLVDDWIETGSQALAAQRLIADAGAELVAVAVIVDEAADDARASLPPIRSIVTAADLR
jgi:adenine phosphoribosyltransferase